MVALHRILKVSARNLLVVVQINTLRGREGSHQTLTGLDHLSLSPHELLTTGVVGEQADAGFFGK